jgi:hypothetical protein
MRVLVACEFSGVVRDAFIARGHDAMSCDLLETERPGPHHQGDVRPLLRHRWDLVIAHPDCTFITNSGVRWLDRDIDRWKQMWAACEFFRECLGANANRVAVENPIPHKYAARWIGDAYTQAIQPWQFGHGETKATCLWLRGLTPLRPTNIVSGRKARVHRASPGPDRWKERSRTMQGIADAMAAQWGAERIEVAA